VVAELNPILHHPQRETSALSSRVYTSLHQPDFQDKEGGDIGMITERCRALHSFGYTTARLEDVVGPLSPSNPHRGTHVKVPTGNFEVRALNEHVTKGDMEQ
jgi:hypothetical protein